MPADGRPTSENDRRIAGCVALAAAVLHGALTLWLFPAPLQFAKYPAAAAQYLAGTLPVVRIVDFSPFYFYLHVVQAALLPGEVVVFLQWAVAGAAAGLLYLLLRTRFPRAVALAGTVAFVLARGVMVYTPVLEPELFLLLFLIGALLLLEGEGGRAQLGAGALFALALSVRPNVLPLVLLAPAALFLRRGWPGWRPTARLLAPSLVLLALLAVRNHRATGEASPLGMNPGFVFFEGNNPLSTGRSAVYPPIVGELSKEIPEHPDNPHLTYRVIASRAEGRALTTGEANRYWREKALAYLSDHPSRALALLATKARTLVQHHRLHDLTPAERYDRRLVDAHVPAVPFALLLALAAAGAVLSLRAWRLHFLMYALLASQSAVMLVMYVSERQRLALLPAILWFACAALVRAWEAPARARAVGAAAVGVAAVLLSLPTDLVAEHRHHWRAHETSDRARALAREFRDGRQVDDARRAAAIAYAAAPWLRDHARPASIGFQPEGFPAWALASFAALEDVGGAPRRFDRAQVLLAADSLDAAEASLRSLVAEGRTFDRGFLQPSDPRFFLARVAAARGERAEAVRHLEAALAANPGDPFVLADLAALTGDAAYRERIVRYFGEIDADFLVGVAEVEHDVDGAAARLQRTTERLPELWRAKIYLAAALGAEGETERAAELFFREATLARPDPVLLENHIVPIFVRAAEASPNDAETRYREGLVLAQYGRHAEALGALVAARSLTPTPEVEAALAEVERMRAAAAAATAGPEGVLQ